MKTAVFAMTMFALAISASDKGAKADTLKGECLIDEAAALNNRIHLHCWALYYPQAVNDAVQRYLAVESNSPLAAQALIVAAYAMRKDKHNVTVFFDTNTSHNPAGCLAKDCWRLTGIAVAP